MIERGLIDEPGVIKLRERVQAAMTEVIDLLLESDPDKPGKRRIRPELWPDTSFVNVGVRGDGTELDALPTLDRVRSDSPSSSSSTPSPRSWTAGWRRTRGSS